MLTPATHSIKPNENLTSIAKAHGIAGWQALYFATCNKNFRFRHPNPDRIPVGGKIMIPIDPAQQREAIRGRIAKLRARRQTAHELWKEEERVIDQAFNELQGSAEAVDTVATVALVLNSLTQLTYKGFKAMKLADDAREAANRVLARDTLIGKAKTHGRDNVALVASQMKKESTNTVWLITKSVAQSWCDLTSPSFWANTIINLQAGNSWNQSVRTKPEDLRRKMKLKLQKSSLSMLSSLDKVIHEAEKELQAISAQLSPLR